MQNQESERNISSKESVSFFSSALKTQLLELKTKKGSGPLRYLHKIEFIY
jgi:hypothetical protein